MVRDELNRLPMSKKINVVIAESNPLVQIGLKTVLNQTEDIAIIDVVNNEEALILALESHQIDVILLDFTEVGFSLETVPNILKASPNSRVVAITPDQEGTTIVNALKAGVRSYVKKDCDFDEIVSSVRQTARGNKFFCGKILESIHRSHIDPEDESIRDFTCEPVQLSEREQEIITLIAEGYTNGAIAEKLFLSPHTINTHRKNIMQKLGVKNTAAIVMYAVKTHLVNVNKFLFYSP